MRVLDDQGHVLEERPAVDGVVRADRPPQMAAVEAVTADGTALGRTPLMEPDIDLEG